jgi:hypothetical protein
MGECGGGTGRSAAAAAEFPLTIFSMFAGNIAPVADAAAGWRVTRAFGRDSGRQLWRSGNAKARAALRRRGDGDQAGRSLGANLFQRLAQAIFGTRIAGTVLHGNFRAAPLPAQRQRFGGGDAQRHAVRQIRAVAVRAALHDPAVGGRDDGTGDAEHDWPTLLPGGLPRRDGVSDGRNAIIFIFRNGII